MKRINSKPLIVGLTGAFGSGKSLSAGYFKMLGAKVIDADKVAHQILRDKAVLSKLTHLFGKGILCNRAISRERLGAIAFSKKENIKKLCQITHGAIIRKIKQIANTCKKKVVVIDAPLLIESGFHKEMDAVIVVSADKKKRLRRCLKAGFSKKTFLERSAAQLPLSFKLRYADYKINNNGTKAQTKESIHKIKARLTKEKWR